MIRFIFLFLLTFLPLFATSSHIAKAQGLDGGNLTLSSNSVLQKSQNTTLHTLEVSKKNQSYLQSQISIILILLGFAFMIVEIFVPGFGILGIGGVIAFASGSLLLFDADTVGRSISIPLIIAFSICSLAFFVLVMKLFSSSKSTKVVSGVDEMIGADAKVVDVKEKGYMVRCHGETWSATSQSKLSIGQRVKVVELLGLTLSVKPTQE